MITEGQRWHVVFGLLLVVALAARVVDLGRSDLHPWPDGPEYAATARSLLDHGTFKIPFAGQWVPPGHGFGFPLLIAPFLAILGHDLAYAHLATLALFVVELLLVFALAERCYGRTAGLLAALFLAASPVDAEVSRRIMSEVPSAAAMTGALLLVCGGAASGSDRGRAFACGFVLAVACWMRYVNALLVVPVAVVALLAPGSRGAGVRRVGWLLGGLLVGLLPVAVYNLRTLGAVTRIPHSVWVPDHKTLLGPFRLGHALAEGKACRYVAALLGNPDDCLATVQPLYPMFVPALALAAGFIGRGRSGLSAAAAVLQRVAGPLVLIILAIGSFYFSETDLRLLHGAVPIVCAVAAGSAVRLFGPIAEGLAAGRSRALLCLAALAWPAWSLGSTVYASPLGQRVLAGHEQVPAVARDHLKLIDEATEPDAWIVSDSFDPLFFFVEDRGQRRLLSVFGDRVAADDVVVESLDEVPERLGELLARGAHVYFAGEPDTAQASVLAGYALTPIASRTYFHGWITLEVWRVGPRMGGRADRAESR